MPIGQPQNPSTPHGPQVGPRGVDPAATPTPYPGQPSDTGATDYWDLRHLERGALQNGAIVEWNSPVTRLVICAPVFDATTAIAQLNLYVNLSTVIPRVATESAPGYLWHATTADLIVGVDLDDGPALDLPVPPSNAVALIAEPDLWNGIQPGRVQVLGMAGSYAMRPIRWAGNRIHGPAPE